MATRMLKHPKDTHTLRNKIRKTQNTSKKVTSYLAIE